MTRHDVAAWAAVLLSLGAVAVYLVWLLPRLASRFVAGVLTGSMGSLGAIALLGGGLWAAAALAAAVALSFGHLGWLLGRHRPAPEARRPPGAERLEAESASRSAATAATRADRVGPYRIERTLGRGAMGAVYLAHDARLGRHVALKTLMLGREFQGEALTEARRRFFREAELAGRLRHPDIVGVFDAGEADGLAYLAMEYVPGVSLQQHAVHGRLLPMPLVCSTIAQVADALAYAHRQGVVHRDVKPANVMFDAATGSVRVTDFGVARVADASRTRTGLLLGTPAFMSPEQMTGSAVDGRSDLYSLGAMLFQLLTGGLPHESESMAVLMRLIVREPAPDVRNRRADVPEALAHVVRKALEKRPEDRYADGTRLAADLRRNAAAMGGRKSASPAAAAAEMGPADELEPGADSITFDREPAGQRPDTRHNSPR